jgi:hypothetical protein
MPWNYRRFGSASDPIHKSHLNALVSDYGCPRRFRYEMDALADALPGADERTTVPGKAAAGTAAHETIARALAHPTLREAILHTQHNVTRDTVRKVFEEEYERELGGRQAQWFDANAHDELEDRITMVTGLLNDLRNHVAEVVLVEPGFIAKLGEYWLSGHVDIIYRPRHAPHTLALADWKTGAHKPHPIELDHGWEAGVYSAAMRHGYFVPRNVITCAPADGGCTRATIGTRSVTHPSRYIAEREVLERTMIDMAEHIEGGAANDNANPFALLETLAFAAFPAQIHYVHLADYVPYAKAGKKRVTRAEDIAHYGYDSPRLAHAYKAGETRGPAWLPVKLTEYDLPRLQARLRNVIGMVRMGRFVDQVGERCVRCLHRYDCLTSGYGPTGDTQKQLDKAIRALGSFGTDAADSISVDDG